ncbi:hypothetical protein BLA29_002546 [Euroglyphus maynei]|uniref:Uncharacterized protein n=1 Tax=Euroglyphus maynei TaxID=6958 RepID=A0A1Y3BLE5_EURMA|nr:hypothetical protein BLA29_002546 [Euroglyphus maynei]
MAYLNILNKRIH